MKNLRQLQSELMGYLTNKESKVSDYIAEGGLIDVDKRLQIYGNAYKVRLRGVIDTDHELLSFYLGDDLFDKLVDEYIAKYPSHFPSLRDYCSNIPTFLKEMPPFSAYPVIGELARFEQTLLFSFDVADAELASIADLSAVPPEAWPELRLRFHPGVQIFSTPTNCVEVWRALKVKNDPPPAENYAEPVHWLVWRTPERITEFRSLDNNEYNAINLFLRGGDLAEVCEGLLASHAEDEVSKVAVEFISNWLSRGIIAKLSWD